MDKLTLVLLNGRQADDNGATAPLGLIVARADMRKGFDRLGDRGDANFRVLELAVTILEQEFDLVTVEQEVLGAADFDEEVMHIDTRTEFDLLHFGRGLLVLMLLGFFVEVLAVFLQLADGRHGGRGDLDEVDAKFASEVEGLLRSHDAHHFAFRRDDADFGRPNAVVALGSLILFAEVAALLGRIIILRPGTLRTVG